MIDNLFNSSKNKMRFLSNANCLFWFLEVPLSGIRFRLHEYLHDNNAYSINQYPLNAANCLFFDLYLILSKILCLF